jgi:peptidylprolyl isomerase
VRSRLAAIGAVLVVFGGVAACGANHGTAAGAGHGSTSPNPARVGRIPGLTVTGKVGTPPTVKIIAPLKVRSAETKVLVAGHGNTVQKDQEAMFQLYLANGRTGKKALSTYDRGAPLTQQMSPTGFLPQLVNAMVGKSDHSRIAFVDPTKDIWPKGQSSLGLKPTDPAVFVIDIMSVQPQDVLNGPKGTKVAPPKDAPRVIEQGGKVTGLDWSHTPKKPPNKLEVIPLVKGHGPVAKSGTLVTFNYYGAVWRSNKPFDSSYTRPQPTPFGVGVHGLIPGWDKTIPGLHRGSRVLLIVPPQDGYGSQAQQNIPANSTLVFVVDVLGVDG